MSDLPASIDGMDAWAWFERLDGWRADREVMAHRGLTCFADRLILLRKGLTQRAERSVLMHEVVHAERGPFPRWMTPHEEEVVSREAARRLIPIRQLGDALAWSLNLSEAAEELHVDRPTLEARLRGLHPSERHYLVRRLEHHE